METFILVAYAKCTNTGVVKVFSVIIHTQTRGNENADDKISFSSNYSSDEQDLHNTYVSGSVYIRAHENLHNTNAIRRP